VLTNNNMATATLAAAVAITTTAAHKHGADVGQVWKLVRRYRELIHEQPSSLRYRSRAPKDFLTPPPAETHRGARPVGRAIG